MGISRRLFLHRAGAAGGFGAAYSAMRTLGLMAAVSAAPPALAAGMGSGKSVVILGGGIAGLVSAYELERAGYKVTVLEARERLGGRNWTLRGGSKVEMVGEVDQTASFADGIYMNAGPARIPSHHQGLLDYCHKLGVPLEVEVNSSRSAYFQADNSNGGKPIRLYVGVTGKGREQGCVGRRPDGRGERALTSLLEDLWRPHRRTCIQGHGQVRCDPGSGGGRPVCGSSPTRSFARIVGQSAAWVDLL
jgi:hypothetical protein